MWYDKTENSPIQTEIKREMTRRCNFLTEDKKVLQLKLSAEDDISML